MVSRKPLEQPRLTFPPLTRTPLPVVEEAGTLSTGLPWLYSAILGNGRLLVCLDETGSIAQLFYPYIDAGPHRRTFFAGILAQEAFSPLDKDLPRILTLYL